MKKAAGYVGILGSSLLATFTILATFIPAGEQTKETAMNGKILGTFASRSGSTQGVAEAIGKTLAESGAPVDVKPMQEVKDLSAYRAVVAGSAIHSAEWLPEAMQFIQEHRVELVCKPSAAFLVCMTLAMKNGSNYRQQVSAWLAPVRELIHPVSEGLFGGAFDMGKVQSFSDRLKSRIGIMTGFWPVGDHRD